VQGCALSDEFNQTKSGDEDEADLDVERQTQQQQPAVASKQLQSVFFYRDSSRPMHELRLTGAATSASARRVLIKSSN